VPVCKIVPRARAAAFVDREGERLFAVDVFARLHGAEVDQCVPMVGRGVDDHVHVVALQHAAKITVDLRRSLALDREPRRSLGRMLRVDVADGHDIAVIRRVGRDAPALPAATDEGDAGPVVGPEPTWARRFRRHELPLDRPQRQPGRRGDNAAPFKKGSAGNME
jgi:hypothetical protein